MIKIFLYSLLIDKLNKSLMNDENVLKLPANPIRNKIINFLSITKLLLLLNDSETPKIIEAIKFTSSNLLLLLNFIEQKLFIKIYLKFAPSNDPVEIVES